MGGGGWGAVDKRNKVEEELEDEAAKLNLILARH